MAIKKYATTLLCLFLPCYFSLETSLKGFDDSILFSLNWPGKEHLNNNLQLDENKHSFQEIDIQTDRKEKFKCYIPQIVEKEKDSPDKYSGPNPLDHLFELFAHGSCAYRLEAYWTYELCHGSFVRQYHEEREGKKVKTQEYFLGRWDKSKQQELREALQQEEKSRPGHPVPVKKVDGLNMPYIQLNMTDGTLCDLSAKPRMTKVLYVCYALGKHEIYSLKETSICEYEVIVLSPLLCSHPRYRPQESGENVINCVPVDNAASKPRNLLQLEAESTKLRHQKISVGDKPRLTVFSVKPGQDGLPRVRVEIVPLDSATTVNEQVDAPVSPAETPVDTTAFNDFVSGRNCIQGGSGWWKYEFCFGHSVTQFHVEKDGSRTVVNLGNFIKAAHLKWIADNPHKRPMLSSHVSYLYTKGSLCEETGLPRQTEVKLKCPDPRTSSGSVSLYLLEPRTCQYVLGVESHLVCKLLQQVDEDGLLVSENSLGFSRADYKSGYEPTKESSGTKSKKNERMKLTILLTDEDNLDNHIPDGDE